MKKKNLLKSVAFRKMVKTGVPYRQIAETFGLSPARCAHYGRKLGIHRHRPFSEEAKAKLAVKRNGGTPPTPPPQDSFVLPSVAHSMAHGDQPLPPVRRKRATLQSDPSCNLCGKAAKTVTLPNGTSYSNIVQSLGCCTACLPLLRKA